MERIEQVVNHIQNHLAHPLPLTELSDVACMSPIHFHRTFVRATGYTPKTFVEIHRIRESLEAIKKDMKVQDIAYSLGYNSYETFSRTFKKYMHIPPADLKALLYQMENETNSDTPCALVRTQNPRHIAELFLEEVRKGTFDNDQLSALQVCTVRPKPVKSFTRKLSERYSLQLDPDLSQKVLEIIY